MKRFVIAAVVLLALAHQDFWWWSDTTLVFGFLPTGLAYHVFYTLLTAALWALACRYAWPAGIEEYARAPDEERGSE